MAKPSGDDAVETPRRRRPLLRWLRFGLLSAVAIIVLLLALFVINGVFLADGEQVRSGRLTSVDPAADAGEIAVDPALADDSPREVRIVAFNIAKLFAHQGGASFAEPEVVRARLAECAQLIRRHDPDLVFLSETLRQCNACPVNQVEELAAACELEYWAFGENFNFGVPFYRIVGGNAILSRWPLESVANPSLSGRQPFWVTKNNRRALWCRLRLNNSPLLICAVHNDSFHLANNRIQAEELLDFAGDRPALLAGDFNARPSEPPMQFLQESGKFGDTFDGPLTFPADSPNQKIDFILAPPDWQVVEHGVESVVASDHAAVFAVFRLPE